MKLRDALILLGVLAVLALIAFSSARDRRGYEPGDAGGRGLDSVWAGAPPPGFSTLRRVVVLRDHPGAPGDTAATSLTTVVRRDGWRTVTHTEDRDRRDPHPVSTLDEVGAFDLMEASWTAEVRRGDLWTRSVFRVEEVSAVTGRLFPLAVGNRLRFDVRLRAYMETPDGRLSPVRTRRSYQFVVTGITDRWARATPAVPGRVFVIRFRMDGDVGPMETELHYSEALGAAVFEREELEARDEGVTGIREVWLTEWH